MSVQTTMKTFTIESVLASRPSDRCLTNLKFMVNATASQVSSSGIRRVAAKLMNARDTGLLQFTHEMRSMPVENYLISDILS